MLKDEYEIKGEQRSLFGKIATASLRSEGFVPAVVYSKKEKGNSDSIKISLKDAEAIVSDYMIKSKIININIDGNNRTVMLKDATFNPITDAPYHLDFAEVSKGDIVVASLPVRVINTEKSIGVKRGGDFFILKYNVPLQIVATKEPQEILVDATDSIVGQRFRVSDAIIPSSSKIIKDILIAKLVGRKSSANDVKADSDTDKEEKSK